MFRLDASCAKDVIGRTVLRTQEIEKTMWSDGVFCFVVVFRCAVASLTVNQKKVVFLVQLIVRYF